MELKLGRRRRQHHRVSRSVRKEKVEKQRPRRASDVDRSCLSANTIVYRIRKSRLPANTIVVVSGILERHPPLSALYCLLPAALRVVDCSSLDTIWRYVSGARCLLLVQAGLVHPEKKHEPTIILQSSFNLIETNHPSEWTCFCLDGINVHDDKHGLQACKMRP